MVADVLEDRRCRRRKADGAHDVVVNEIDGVRGDTAELIAVRKQSAASLREG